MWCFGLWLFPSLQAVRVLASMDGTFGSGALLSLNPHVFKYQNQKQLVVVLLFMRYYGWGMDPGRMPWVAPEPTLPSAWQDSCVPLVLRDLHPKGQLRRVLVILEQPPNMWFGSSLRPCGNQGFKRFSIGDFPLLAPSET